MDFEGNMFCVNNGNREQNSNSNNSTNFGWDLWEPTTSSNSTLMNTFYTADTSIAVAPTRHEASLVNALMFLPQATTATDRDEHERQPPLDGSHVHLDPNLACLKLGKRHYFEDANAPLSGGAVLAGKRGRGYHGGGGGGGGASTVPRCQVEGCHVALLNAKDYHRRHKVCEMHSKAPKVVVLGLEQRFCQQCSRFHVVSEFDDSKRSCRRRLAGHNERRRKSFHESVARNSSQEKRFMVGGFPYLSSSPPPPPSSGCVLSLLSSCKSDHPWLSSADLSTRCSAALRELIAENRAAIMSKQIILDRDGHPHHHHAAVVEDDGINKEIHPESNYSFPQHHQMFP